MPLMDYKALFKRLLPHWTLLNIILTALSVVSALILYLTNTLFPSTQSLLEFTLVSFVNAVFILYWTFWFILVVPPIIGGLYFSRTDPEYYRFAFTNFLAVVVLFIVKLLFNFDILSLAI